MNIFKLILIFLPFVLVTLILGAWQLYRLDWKNNLIESFNLLGKSNPVELEDAEIKEFLKIKTTGTINRKKKIFFPAKTLNGKAGIRLASEFISNKGKIYLLDEGWFKNNDRSYFKSNNDVFEEVIVGYIRFPRKAKFFTPSNNLRNNEWYTYNLNTISDFLNIPLENKFFIKKMSVNKEVFLIPSSHRHEFRNNHLHYAITWFCMSFSFLILFLVYLKKNK